MIVSLLLFPWLFGVLALVLVAIVVLAGAPAIQSWQLARLARQVGLGVPVDLESALRDRVRRRLRAGAIGALVGLAMGLILEAVFGALSGSLPGGSTVGATVSGFFAPYGGGVPSVAVTSYGLLALSATGSTLASAASSAHGTLRDADGTRVARMRVTRASDYVPPLLHGLAWFVCLMAVVTVLLEMASPAAAWVVVGPGIGLAVVGVLAFLGYELISRVVVGHAQPASDTDELVWDDALRSVALSELLTAPLAGLSLGALWTVAGIAGGAPLAWVPMGLGVIALIAFSYIRRRTYDWYLANLWPGARRRTPEEEAERLASHADEARRAQFSSRPTNAHAR